LNPKAWMDYMFDHTTIIAEDDPALENFRRLDVEGIIQLRILPSVGAEQFARFVFEKLNAFVGVETHGRVQVTSVQFRENERNTASYSKPLDSDFITRLQLP
jgi:6-pyruvoyltetrahydropterin/6-carboxytetrahydropterin synthase